MAKGYMFLDAMNIAYRSFYALPSLTTSSKVPVGAVFGFLNSVYSAKVGLPEGRLVAFWDSRPSWRRQLWPSYKANRKRSEQEEKQIQPLWPQVELIKKFLLALGIPSVSEAPFEADDLLAVAVDEAAPEPVIIVSSDQDFLQLLSNRVAMEKTVPGTRKIYGEPEFKETFGISPKLWPHVKALAGDASDNYKPVRGLGPASALILVKNGTRCHRPYKAQPERCHKKISEAEWEDVQKCYLLAKLPPACVTSSARRGVAVALRQKNRPNQRQFEGLCGDLEFTYFLSKKWTFLA